MFAIDPRSLAAFRIAIAALLLCDLFGRAQDLQAFYTDDGLLPRMMQMELGYGDPLGFQHQWSIHLLNGQWWSQAMLLAITAWFAIWLLVGYRTKLATFASWLLVLSLDNRNVFILDGGDSILCAMLLWTLFLPLGICWSVDSASQPDSSNKPQPISSVLSAVPLLQIALVYWCAAAFKWHPVWNQEFSAVYYVLHGDTFITQFGQSLREYPAIMQWLTGGTLVWEVVGPLLAFSPWANPWCRGLAIAGFTLFHIGLSLTMTLALFPWICIATWLLFVPTPFWDWCEQRGFLQRLGERIQLCIARIERSLPQRWITAAKRRTEEPRVHSQWWLQVLVGALFVYVVFWNVREIMGMERGRHILSNRLNGLACALGLNQNWSLFAPLPRIEDGWLVMKGTLRDGSEVNLWEPGKSMPWDKPQLVSAMFPSTRWRRYLENLPLDRFAFHRQILADWLRRRWDREFSGGRPEKTVAKVEIIRQTEVTPPPGEPIPAPESVELCVRHYEMP